MSEKKNELPCKPWSGISNCRPANDSLEARLKLGTPLSEKWHFPSFFPFFSYCAFFSSISFYFVLNYFTNIIVCLIYYYFIINTLHIKSTWTFLFLSHEHLHSYIWTLYCVIHKYVMRYMNICFKMHEYFYLVSMKQISQTVCMELKSEIIFLSTW